MASNFLPFGPTFTDVCILCALPVYHTKSIENAYDWLYTGTTIKPLHDVSFRDDQLRNGKYLSEEFECTKLPHPGVGFIAHSFCCKALFQALNKWLEQHPTSPWSRFTENFSMKMEALTGTGEHSNHSDTDDDSQDEEEGSEESFDEEDGSTVEHDGIRSIRQGEEEFPKISATIRCRIATWLRSLVPNCLLPESDDPRSYRLIGAWPYPLANIELTRKALMGCSPRSEYIDELMLRLAGPQPAAPGPYRIERILELVIESPSDKAEDIRASVDRRFAVEHRNNFVNNDPFARIAMDTCLEILSLLSIDDVINVRQASPAMASVHLANGFFYEIWLRTCKVLPDVTDQLVQDWTKDGTKIRRDFDWKLGLGRLLEIIDSNPDLQNFMTTAKRMYHMAEEIFGTTPMMEERDVPEKELPYICPFTALIRGRGGIGSGLYQNVMIRGARCRDENFPAPDGSTLVGAAAPLERIVVFVDHKNQLRGFQFHSRDVEEPPSDIFGYGDSSEWRKHIVQLNTDEHLCGIVVGVSTGSVICGVRFCIGVSDKTTNHRLRETMTRYIGNHPTEKDFNAEDGSGYYHVDTPVTGQHKVVGITGIVDYIGIRAIGFLEARLERYAMWWYSPKNRIVQKKSYLAGPYASLDETVSRNSMDVGPNLILPLSERKTVVHFPLPRLVRLDAYEGTESIVGLSFEWCDGTVRDIGKIGPQKKRVWELVKIGSEEEIEKSRIGGIIVAALPLGQISAIAVVTVGGKIGEFAGNIYPRILVDETYTHMINITGETETLFEKEINSIAVAYDPNYGLVQLGLHFGQERRASPIWKFSHKEVPFLHKTIITYKETSNFAVSEEPDGYAKDFIRGEETCCTRSSNNQGEYRSYLDLRKPITGLVATGWKTTQGFIVGYADGTIRKFGNTKANVMRKYDWSNSPKRVTAIRRVHVEPFARKIEDAGVGYEANKSVERDVCISTHEGQQLSITTRPRLGVDMDVLQFSVVDFDNSNPTYVHACAALYEIEHSCDGITRLCALFAPSSTVAVIDGMMKRKDDSDKKSNSFLGPISDLWSHRLNPLHTLPGIHTTQHRELSWDEVTRMEYILFDGPAGERLQAIAFYIGRDAYWKPFVGLSLKREGAEWTYPWGSFHRVDPYMAVWNLEEGERVVGCHWRQGCWLDAVSVATQKRCSPLFGKEDGGSQYQAFEDEENIAIGFYHRRSSGDAEENQMYDDGSSYPFWGIITRPRRPSDPPFIPPSTATPSNNLTRLSSENTIIAHHSFPPNFLLSAVRFYALPDKVDDPILCPPSPWVTRPSFFIPCQLIAIEFLLHPIHLPPFVTMTGIAKLTPVSINPLPNRRPVYSRSREKPQDNNPVYSTRTLAHGRVERVEVRGTEGERVMALRTWAREGLVVGVEIDSNWGRCWRIGDTGKRRHRDAENVMRNVDATHEKMDLDVEAGYADNASDDGLELIGCNELKEGQEAIGFLLRKRSTHEGPKAPVVSIHLIAVDIESVREGKLKLV